MRVGISGAQCTGKSTLLRALKGERVFQNFLFIEEVVRSLIKEGIKINKEADHYSQCAILEKHYKNSISYDNYFTDRCCVDAFVYSIYNYLQGKFSFKEHREHESLFLSSLPQYTHHLYLYPLGFLEQDGVRDADLQYQTEICSLFEWVYKKYSIDVILLDGDVNNRLVTVRKFLKIK